MIYVYVWVYIYIIIYIYISYNNNTHLRRLRERQGGREGERGRGRWRVRRGGRERDTKGLHRHTQCASFAACEQYNLRFCGNECQRWRGGCKVASVEKCGWGEEEGEGCFFGGGRG